MPLTMPSHLKPSFKRDHPINDINQIREDLMKASNNDNARAHIYKNLSSLYSPDHISGYDMFPGFMATATLFASHILLTSPITSYLDLGAGTGLTAVATARVLLDAGYNFRLIVVDGVSNFLEQALDKVQSYFPQRMWAGQTISCLRSDVFSNMAGLQEHLLEKQGLPGISLITAQRVFFNLRKDLRAQQLRRWASLLTPGGRLVVDIPHPRCRIAAFMIGPPPHTCRIIVDSVTWDGCREYARSLADEVGLRIVNDMPPHLQPFNQEDGVPDFLSWVDACKAPTLPRVLGQDELDWFGLRYATECVPSYQRQGYPCTVEIAAVIVVFERDAVMELTASTSELTVEIVHTKYAIDESLTGGARKKAIKQAAKQGKTEKKAMGKGDNDDEGTGASGTVA